MQWLATVDPTHPAPRWWAALYAAPELASVAADLRRYGTVVLFRDVLRRLEALPGWDEGPLVVGPA